MRSAVPIGATRACATPQQSITPGRLAKPLWEIQITCERTSHSCTLDPDDDPQKLRSEIGS